MGRALPCQLHTLRLAPREYTLRLAPREQMTHARHSEQMIYVMKFSGIIGLRCPLSDSEDYDTGAVSQRYSRRA